MIYLVEDDDSIRKLVIYALENQGFAAQGFETPKSFWRAMKHQLPDLILLDIMLPEQDGISILQCIRDNEKTEAIPVIMLTAKNSEYDRVQGLDAGADDYISKPFGMMELVARVRAGLRRRAPKNSSGEYRMGIRDEFSQEKCLWIGSGGLARSGRTGRWTCISGLCGRSWEMLEIIFRRCAGLAIG